jgi:thioredoxin reductase (NADPH)
VERTHYPVIAVGGGPAGISLAIECVEQGLAREDVLVLEKGEVIVKAIQQFYPDKKMTLANYKNLPTETHGHLPCFPDLTKAETIVYFDELIKKYELQYHLKAEVSKVMPREDGRLSVWVNQRELTADVVAIGIGILGRPNKPSFKIPLKLKDQVLFDLTTVPVKSGKVLVVGGGDTSSEYCQILVAEACEVSLCYRGKDFHRMMESNRDAALKLNHEGKLRFILEREIAAIEEVEGRPKVIYQGDHEPEIYDRVIYAIGGTTPVNFLKTIGVEFDEKQWPKAGPSGETNVPGVYLTGDLIAGKTGGSIITAYNSCFRTAKSICDYLSRSRR